LPIKFPEKYQQKLQSLIKVYDSVEKTHIGCGKLALMEVLSDASNRTLLVIGSSGTGKSAILKWMKDVINRDHYFLDSVTVSGLKHIAKYLKGKTLSLLVDDLSKGGTEYSQAMTVCALGELVYSGYIRKFVSGLNLDIYGFSGSAIMNAQPLILRRILRSSEFETDIRDKVIRYYHIRRPIKIELKPPSDNIEYNYLYNSVIIPDDLTNSKLMEYGLDLFRYEFSIARAKEHYYALIKASANINNRKEVDEADLWLVNELCKCFYLETELFSKRDLEGEIQLDVNILVLLSVLATYKKYSFIDAMADFQIKQSRLYEIIKDNERYVGIIKNRDKKYIVPTKAGRDLLKMVGEW
jgi:energy-coupling factor transporter ATP-binding protein EcfA2